MIRLPAPFIAPLMLLLIHALGSAAEPRTSAAEWPQWRGPQRDGISPETGLLGQWNSDKPRLVWQVRGLGRGYAGVAVTGGKVFTLGRRGRSEQLVALSDVDGSELWAVDVGSADHSNCTPTVDASLVFAVGLKGDLVCAEADKGAIVWRKSYADDFGGRMMSGWGYSESPLVDGEKLICTPGGNDTMIAALEKRTGRVIWKSAMPRNVGTRGQDGAGYSSVVVSEGAGVRQYVQLVGRGLIGVDANTGSVLWTYNKIANGTANIPTPIVKGDYVFCSSGYGTGAALLKLERAGRGVRAREQYFLPARQMQNHHGGMVLVGEHIFCGNGHNQGFPLCVEMMTGKVAWQPGRGAGTGSAAVTYADGNLYFRYENGVMALIAANPRQYSLRGTFEIASKIGASWPHPAIAGKRLYLRDQDVLLCYDLSAR